MKSSLAILLGATMIFIASSCKKHERAAKIPDGMEPDPFSQTGFSPKPTDEQMQEEFERQVRVQADQWLFYQDNYYHWLMIEEEARAILMQQTTPGATEVRKIEYQESKLKASEAKNKFDQEKEKLEEVVGSGRKASLDFKGILLAHEKKARLKWSDYCAASTAEAKRRIKTELLEINKRPSIAPPAPIVLPDTLK